MTGRGCPRLVVLLQVARFQTIEMYNYSTARSPTMFVSGGH